MLWGPQLKWFRQLAEDGILVKAFKEMPRLYDDLLISYEAFWTLSSSRPIGIAGPGMIPFSEIAAYIRYRGITDPDIQDEIVENTRTLDREYLAELKRINDREDAKKKASSNGN